MSRRAMDVLLGAAKMRSSPATAVIFDMDGPDHSEEPNLNRRGWADGLYAGSRATGANRELNGGIRELFGRIREEALGSRFLTRSPRYEGPRRYCRSGVLYPPQTRTVQTPAL